MEESATSTQPATGNDSTDLLQNSTTRSGATRTKIEHYFATPSTSTRQSFTSDASSISDISLSSSSNEIQTRALPKKFKITAGNGRDVAMRQPERKKVKRETTLENMEDYANMSVVPSVRRHNSRAKLRMLPSFPLDIVFEIFSHLHPSDVLHLSRTTKDMRRLLLHGSASYIWKTVLSNVPGLPVWPEDVSLPVWASLIFDSYCQKCLTHNVRSVNFYLRVRYCNKCIKTKLISENVFTPETNKLHEIILQAVPFSFWNERKTPARRRLPVIDGTRTCPERFCTLEDKESFVKELDAVCGDRSAFVEERKAAIKLRHLHAKECKKWFEDIVNSREAELDSIRLQRKLKIRENLQALGFQAELSFLDRLEMRVCAIHPWPRICEFSSHAQVKLPKSLTEKAWAKIKDEMVRYMEEVSPLVIQNKRFLLERRRRVAFHTAYVNWRHKPTNLETYPADMLMPGPADVLETSPIKVLIKGDDDTEYDIKVAMIIISSAIPTFVAGWRDTVLKNLYYKAAFSNSNSSSFLSWIFPGPDSCLPHLKLAAVVFHCTGGAHWRYDQKRMEDDGVWIPNSGVHLHEVKDNVQPCLWYPHFFFHPCSSMEYWGFDERRAGDHKNLSLEKQYGGGYRRGIFNMEHLEFDEKASRTVKNLLDAAGLSHDSTTVEDMDRLDHRFVCLKCTFGARCDGSRRVRVWSWRDAVQHCFKSHFGDARVTWECILPEDADKAQQLQIIEGLTRGYLLPQNCKLWKCMRCRDTSADHGRITLARLKSHFRHNRKHGDPDKMDDKEGVWYYKALDYSPRELAAIKITPASTTS